MRAERSVGVAVLACVIAGCGGGGGGTGTAATGEGATAVASAGASSGPATGGAFAPSPAPAPASTPDAAPVVPTTGTVDAVPRRAVAAALGATYEHAATSVDAGDAVTVTRGRPQAGSLDTEVVLAGFDRAEPLARTRLSVDAARAEDALVVGGTMRLSLDVAGADPVGETLAAPQWAMPAQVPLDARLVEWTAASGSAVELSLASVPGAPDRMRVCWRVRARDVRQASCTLHLRADGSVLGGDANHDLGGTIRSHATDGRAERPQRVLPCLRVDTERGQVVAREASHEVFRFEPPVLVMRWDRVHDLSYADPPLFDSGRSALPDGTVRHWARHPRGVVEVDVRDGAVRRYHSVGGIAGSVSETLCER